MGMNNVFYRFQHLSSNEKYSTMPARLRMNVMRTHGVESLDFELWCLAVSAINGCGKCIDAHEKVVREKGATEETILAVVRVASVIHGLARVLDTVSRGPNRRSSNLTLALAAADAGKSRTTLTVSRPHSTQAST